MEPMSVGGFFKKAAPWIAAGVASAVPGPIGMGARLVSEIIGKPVPADPVQINKAVEGMTPEQIAKLQDQDHQYEEAMRKMGFEHQEQLERIQVEDRQNARNREINVKDHTAEVGFYILTAGFFFTLWYVFGHGVKPETHDLSMIMVGVLGTGWTSAIAYFYGSSKGSDTKNEIISNLSK
jgi:hypothetical protein